MIYVKGKGKTCLGSMKIGEIPDTTEAEYIDFSRVIGLLMFHDQSA